MSIFSRRLARVNIDMQDLNDPDAIVYINIRELPENEPKALTLMTALSWANVLCTARKEPGASWPLIQVAGWQSEILLKSKQSARDFSINELLGDTDPPTDMNVQSQNVYLAIHAGIPRLVEDMVNHQRRMRLWLKQAKKGNFYTKTRSRNPVLAAYGLFSLLEYVAHQEDYESCVVPLSLALGKISNIWCEPEIYSIPTEMLEASTLVCHLIFSASSHLMFLDEIVLLFCLVRLSGFSSCILCASCFLFNTPLFCLLGLYHC